MIRLVELTGIVQRSQDALDELSGVITDTGDCIAKCPTCGQDVDDVVDRIAALQATLATHKPEYDAAVIRQDAIAKKHSVFDLEHNIHNARLAELGKTAQRLSADYKTAKALCPANEDDWSDAKCEEWRQVVREYELQDQAYMVATASANSCAVLVASAKKAREDAEASRSALRVSMEKISTDVAKLTPDTNSTSKV